MDYPNKSERIIAYIDGFNLYFGMKENGNKTLWLNPQLLVSVLLKPSQKLMLTKYFTSRVRNNKIKEYRQNTYIETLETLPNFEITYGHYQSNIKTCRRCGHSYQYSSEKMTDVNIAVSMVEDAHNDLYETAFLITGDSDLVPSINSIHRIYPNKRVFVAFPPNRSNISVKNAAKGSMVIGRKKLLDAQFPDYVRKMDGFKLRRPSTWN